MNEKQVYTIEDVARELGISKTTVSRAISGKGRLSAQTRKRVLDFIAEHNFRPNAVARSLAQSRTFNLGLVLPGDRRDIDTAFFHECMMGICQIATEHDYDVLVAMEADSGIRLEALRVDGGASANDFLMQTQADIIGAPVNRPGCVETTAMGAAYLAGLAVGYWAGPEEIRKNWAIDRTFEPSIGEEERQAKLKGWKKAVTYAYGWAKEE